VLPVEGRSARRSVVVDIWRCVTRKEGRTWGSFGGVAKLGQGLGGSTGTYTMTPLQQLPLFVLAVLALLLGVKANTEKEIFLAPRWQEDQGVGDHLPQLMPSEHCRNCRSARLRLETDFTNDHEFFEDLGKQHWIRIDGLKEGQRYEVRVCWAATVGFRELRASLVLMLRSNQQTLNSTFLSPKKYCMMKIGY
jgi:hypothetical protein